MQKGVQLEMVYLDHFFQFCNNGKHHESKFFKVTVNFYHISLQATALHV